jgi:Ca2+-binding EF-hand superfamily protein
MTIGPLVWAEAPATGAADAQVKALLLLMDRDKNGKVSREEFMKFMSAEFDRLDVNKDGELDVKELTGLRVIPTKHPGGAGSR